MRHPVSCASGKALKGLFAALLALGLSLPTLGAAATAAGQKSASTQKATAKKAVASKKKKTNQVSRSGKQRQPQLTAAQKQRLIALANLPHRVGPTEIFQIAGAQSSLLLQSRAAIVMNAETGELLYSKNADRTMPIASITKLMTAVVVLDAGLPLEELITISPEDVDTLRHSSSRLPVGTTLTRGEAMLLALMSSENRAAASLARTYPGGTPAAVAAMNRKARELGMTHTHFADGTGLHGENTSSPADLVHLVKASRSYPEIHHYSTTTEHTLISQQGRPIQYRNTNALVQNSTWSIEVSKTGFLNEAGRCLVMQARINAQPVVIVLMDSNGSVTRTGDANRIKQWLESAFDIAEAGKSGDHTL